MKEYVTFEIAKIAKEKGYNQKQCDYYYYKKSDNKIRRSEHIDYKQDIIAAMSWNQLIDWIFESIKGSDNGSGNQYNNPIYLDFWYNHLKDCPLSYEFKGRLLEWFRKNNRILFITPRIATNQYIIGISNPYQLPPENYNTYEEAEHHGILEIFKLMKT